MCSCWQSSNSTFSSSGTPTQGYVSWSNNKIREYLIVATVRTPLRFPHWRRYFINELLPCKFICWILYFRCQHSTSMLNRDGHGLKICIVLELHEHPLHALTFPNIYLSCWYFIMEDMGLSSVVAPWQLLIVVFLMKKITYWTKFLSDFPEPWRNQALQRGHHCR